MIAGGVLVHGGAGTAELARHPALVDGVRRAARAGRDALAAGANALDAAVAAVRVLEDDPEFNAGRGAVLTERGTVEADATIMDGATGRIGAIGAVPGAAFPIELARAVMLDGRHVLMTGAAAWAVPGAAAALRLDDAALTTARQHARWQALGAGGRPVVDGGTVGAVVIDAARHLVAATSTGGKLGKRIGRVGDTGLPGAGTWADGAIAVSATGDGEAIIRAMLAREVAERTRAGVALDDAVAHGLALVARFGGQGGLIAVDATGRFAVAANAPTMAWAQARVGVEAIDAAIAPRSGAVV